MRLNDGDMDYVASVARERSGLDHAESITAAIVDMTNAVDKAMMVAGPLMVVKTIKAHLSFMEDELETLNQYHDYYLDMLELEQTSGVV